MPSKTLENTKAPASTRGKLGPFEHRGVRALFLYVTVALVTFAVFQSVGRFAFSALSFYADELTSVTRGLGVQIEGLDGSWSGFNPVLRATRVVFAGGHADQVDIELDVFESLYRGAMIPARVRANKVFLDVVQTESGWQLRGLQIGQEVPDIAAAIRHVDELRVAGDVLLTDRQGRSAPLSLELVLLNRGLRHFGEIKLKTRADRALHASLWEQDELIFFSEKARHIQANGALELPEALIGQAAVAVKGIDISWSESKERGYGEVKARAEKVLIPGEKLSIDVDLAARVRKRLDRLDGLVDVMSLRPTGASKPNIDLSGTRAQLLLSDTPALPSLQVWHAGLDLAGATRFGASVTNPANVVGRWIRGLNARGRFNNIHLFAEFSEGSRGFGFAGTIVDLGLDGYRGAPALMGGQGQLWGDGRAFAMQLNTAHSKLQFPKLFTDTWDMDYLQGMVKAWVGPSYFAMRGSGMKTRIGESNIAGSFSLTRPDPRHEQRLALQLQVDGAEVLAAKSFVPYKIPEKLSDWLAEGPQAGRLSKVTFAYQGQFRVRPGELGRRLELEADIAQGTVRYDSKWPVINDLDGHVHVAGRETRVSVERANSLGLAVADSQVVLVNNGTYARVGLKASGEGEQLLDFVWSSPLSETLNFVTENWRSSGSLALSGQLLVPIRKEVSPALAVDFDFDLSGLDLEIPEYRVSPSQLQGRGQFSLPHNLTGAFTGALFDHPARFEVTNTDEWVRFDIDGRGAHSDVYQLIDSSPIDVIRGEFDFDSVLSIAMTPDRVTNVALQTDLVGLTMSLPAHLAKSAEEGSSSEVEVHFMDDYQMVSWRYKDTQGWIHYGDDVNRGAIGINAAPPTTDHDQQAIVIGGELESFRLSEWVSKEGEAEVALPIDWKISAFKIGRLFIDELEFREIVLSGEQAGDDVRFAFESPDLTGVVIVPTIEPMRVDLRHLRVPAIAESSVTLTESPESVAVYDPIDVSVGYSLPRAEVTVGLLHLGDEPFGSWHFTIIPGDDHVVFDNLDVQVNGVHIDDAYLNWDLAENISTFRGGVMLDNLAETLPLWDYTPVLETSSAGLIADAQWYGSPANVSLVGLSGGLEFTAEDGRFLDVEAGGGLRMMSLLNFSNIVKRINLDFTDVTQEGIGFDNIKAKVSLAEGNLKFIERMIVEGSSSSFQVGGNVNLHTGDLDNEMIVTLPVSDSLPWYGVYLALANPLAGIGVLVGERVLRKPLRAFSTAKFEVKGTLDDPEVKFVGLWDQSISEPDPETPAPLSAVDEGLINSERHDNTSTQP
ncbi:MAG: AsmA-like C-terminal region-containing protein [Pseudomonadota bacterium]|nr:AsmA-like C-terminal region-containing protein [Pseudomonadota bacterium]